MGQRRSSARASPPALPSAGPPGHPPPPPALSFSFLFCSRAQASPRGPRAHCVPRRPGPPLRELGGRPPALPLKHSALRGAGLAGKGAPGALGPFASQTGPLLCPHEPLAGSRSRKVRTEIPSNLFKGLAAARNFFFLLFSLPPTPPLRLQVSSHSFPLTGFDCLTACVFVSSLLNNCSFTPLAGFVRVSRGCFWRRWGWWV